MTRLFLDEGRPAEMLLAQWSAHAGSGPLRDYAARLEAAFHEHPAGAPSAPAIQAAPSAGLVEPLSPRELEVLHLLALGSSTKEIAQHLVVATGTVKAHTASIYDKLDAHNRTAAVARARQLGILS